MSPDQEAALYSIVERVAISFEKIAWSLEGLYGIQKQRFAREYPEREHRDAVVSRVPTDEDRIRSAQGQSDKSIGEWLGDLGESEYVGSREREFIEAKKRDAGSRIDNEDGSGGGGTEEAGG